MKLFTSWIKTAHSTLFHWRRDASGSEDETRQFIERLVAQSPNALRTLVESIPDGVVFLNPTTFQIIDCNEVYASMNGYARTELIGQYVGVVNKETSSPDEHTQYLADLQKNGTLKYQSYHRRKDGSVFPVEVSTSILQLQGRQVVLGIDRDITVRKKIEMELQNTTLRQHDLVNELELQNKEFGLLNEMTQQMEACSHQIETYPVMAEFVKLLLPAHAVAVFLGHDHLSQMSCIAAHGWGPELRMEDHIVMFSTDEWQRFRSVGSSTSTLPFDLNQKMNLFRSDEGMQLYCFPLTDQKERFGIFLVRYAPGIDVLRWNRLAERIAARLSLILANIQLREVLQQQSIRDALTNLFNRRYMQETLEREISRCSRSQHPLSAAILDIDHFKKYNDTYGHPKGDLLLKRFANFLVGQLRKEDVVCRYGGEEFVIILPDMPPEVALARMEEVRRNWVNETADSPDGVTFSSGVSAYPAHGSEVFELIALADRALYRAKSQGRNQTAAAE